MDSHRLKRVAVVGDPSSGKSSVIKRLVSHRFDSLPTRNAQFMGMPSDGRHVSFFNVPPMLGHLGGKAGKREQEVLLELQDQLGASTKLIHEPFWFDVQADVRPARDMDGLSPRSRFLAATSAKAMQSGIGEKDGIEAGASHWTKTLDPRVARAKAGNAGAPSGAPAQQSKIRTGLPPEPDQHPLMAHQFTAASEATKKAVASTAMPTADTSPLQLAHGTHGWLVVYDATSAGSYAQAVAMVRSLLSRVGYAPRSKRPCPITIVLVSNKHDLLARGDMGKKGKAGSSNKAQSQQQQQKAVPIDAICSLLAETVIPGALIGQLKKQEIHGALRKLCEKILNKHKEVYRAHFGSAAASTEPTPKRKVKMNMWGREEEEEEEEEDSNQIVGAPSSASLLKGKGVAMPGLLSESEVKLISKLKGELDRHHFGGGGAHHATDLELIQALMKVVAHPLAQTYADLPPSEILECLNACPALAVKYVEVSCKTNHQVHMLERIALRSLRLLGTGEGSGTKQAGVAGAKAADTKRGGATAAMPLMLAGAGGLLEGLGALFTQGPECWGLRKVDSRATGTASA